MHGRRKIAPSARETAARAEAGKVQTYRKLCARFFQMVWLGNFILFYSVLFEECQSFLSIACFSLGQKPENAGCQDALHITLELLTANADFYTVWNFRRKSLQLLFTRESQDLSSALQLLEKELLWLTQTVMPASPKSYCVWTHRKWCLETLQIHLMNTTSEDSLAGVKKLWQTEHGLINKFLALDGRNFHAWAYRQFVVQKLMETSSIKPVTNETNQQLLLSEFNFTHTKISQNCSNFSAWHYRSKLFPDILQNDTLTTKLIGINESDNRTSAVRRLIDQEFELVHSAVYTEPADQSAWIYLRWLFHIITESFIIHGVDQIYETDLVKRELNLVEELRVLEPRSIPTLNALRFLLQRAYRIMKLSDGNVNLVVSENMVLKSLEEVKQRIQELAQTLCQLDSYRTHYYLES